MRQCVLALGIVASFVGAAATQPPPSAPAEPPARIDEIEKAGAAMQHGRLDEAYKLVQEAVRKYPTLPPARLILGRMAVRVNPQQGRQILEVAAGESPDHPEVYLTMASLAQADHRISDVILNAQKALELAATPSRWSAEQKAKFQREARGYLADAYMTRHDWANARVQLASLLDMDPKNGHIRQRYAMMLFNTGKPDEAFVEFQSAAKDDPTLMPATVAMARQYMAKREYDKAREYFDRAVKQEPNNVRAHLAYADFLLVRGDVDGAKLHVDTALRLEPKNIEVQQLQGLVARFAKDYGTAARVFEEILRQQPANFFAANQLALVLSDMSDEPSRKRGLQLAEVNARQYGNNADAATTLAFSYYRNGNRQQAAEILEKVIANTGGRLTADAAYFAALVLSDDATRIDDAKKFVKAGLETTDVFFFRKDAKALWDKLEKEKPSAPAAATPGPGDKAKEK